MKFKNGNSNTFWNMLQTIHEVWKITKGNNSLQKYAQKSYEPLATLMRYIHLKSFKMIQTDAFNTYSVMPGHEWLWKIKKGNNSQIMQKRIMISGHCTFHNKIYPPPKFQDDNSITFLVML